MRFIVAAFAVAAPAGATWLAAVTGGIENAAHTVAAALPDPSTAAVMFAGFGMIAAARRVRSRTVAD